MAWRNHGGLMVGAAAALGITAAVGAAMVVRHRRGNAEEKEEERGSLDWLVRAGVERMSQDKAAMFELIDLDRSNLFSVGGAGALRCSDTGRDTSVEKLVDVPGLLLYAIEILQGEVLMVFLQVPSVPEAFATHFLDRGVRALAETGSTVYVARLDAVERIPGFVPTNKLSPDKQARILMVWNTGRCGSTLMHKMLQKLGVISFSEPFWLDNIATLPSHGMDHDMIGRVFGVCAAMDISLALRSLPVHAPTFGAASTPLGSGHISFNPKGSCFPVMEPIMKALPNARHMMMYRDVRKVVESFGSIFQEEPSAFGKLFNGLNPWRRRKMMMPQPEKGVVAPIYSEAVAQALASGDIVRPTNPYVERLSLGWMQSICLWQELVQIGAVNSGSTASLRMNDFTRKEPKLIKSIIRFIFGADVEVGEDVIATSLEVFDTHSQAGDFMAKSSHNPRIGKARFLSPADLREIERVTAGVRAIGSPEFIVSGSLGAPVPE